MSVADRADIGANNVLRHKHFKEEQKHGHHERAKDQSHETKQWQTRNHTKNSDERVGVSHALLQDHAQNVIALGDDEGTVGSHIDSA